jgi:hypothetical protein
VSKRELRSLLATLLPHVHGEKQATALFTVVLLLGVSHRTFDAPHLHVETAPMEPTATVMVAATNTASGMMTNHWSSPYNPYLPIR